jgi:hypothetical protein
MEKEAAMTRAYPVFLILAIAVGLAGCAQKEEAEPAAETDITAQDLWEEHVQGYTSLAFWPGREGLMKGESPHGSFVTTYVNAEGHMPDALPYPDGTLVVKENYTADTTLVKLTVMYKAEGYNPKGGDWFWAVYAPDGTVESEGKIQSCISCHAVRAEQDYVFLHTVDGGE